MNALFYTRKLAAGATIVLLAVSAVAQTASDMTAGEVRKVDKDAGKITLKHGDIKNLDMPAMTMVFQVRDPELLNKVKPGDRVRFYAESRDGAIVVTAMEATP
jgi:Cu/Ag efflux protein CusF